MSLSFCQTVCLGFFFCFVYLIWIPFGIFSQGIFRFWIFPREILLFSLWGTNSLLSFLTDLTPNIIEEICVEFCHDIFPLPWIFSGWCTVCLVRRVGRRVNSVPDVETKKSIHRLTRRTRRWVHQPKTKESGKVTTHIGIRQQPVHFKCAYFNCPYRQLRRRQWCRFFSSIAQTPK